MSGGFAGEFSPMPDRPYRTTTQVADFLNLSERAVFRMIDGGDLEAYFRRGELFIVVYDDDLEAMLERGAEAAAEPSRRGDPSPHRDRWAGGERDYRNVLLRDPCCYCGRPTQAIDHIEAQARGGGHSWLNFTASCKRCNSTKGARQLLTFLLGRMA